MLQLLDLAGIYFRAFYSSPASLTGPHGRPINAIRGSLDIIRRVVADGNPTRLVACLDLDWRPAWRVELIGTYKTHRVAGADTAAALPAVGGASPWDAPELSQLSEELVPDDLAPQVPVLLNVLRAIGIPLAGAEGFEADDVIGTLVERETVDPVEVVTGDRDLFQVIRSAPTPATVRYVGAGMAKAEVYTDETVQARYGIPASSYADFAALRGDASDGLPGVAGVGDKTAAMLIARFGSVEALVAALDDPAADLAQSARRKLSAAMDYLAVAPRVVRVARDAPVESDPGGDGRLPASPLDPARLAELVALHGISGPVDRLVATLAGTA